MEEGSSRKTLLIQLAMFIATVITTTIAGAEWMYGKFLFAGEQLLTSSEVLSGMYYSVPFLTILTVHEFGHYLTAKYHNVKVTLPFYIPLWLGFIPIPFTIGTAGAFIRIKEMIHSRKQYFDIGIAGPLAGFVVAVLVLALSKVLEWRVSRVAETIEKPITVPEAPVTDEVRTVSMRRHYVSFAATH